MVEKKKHQKQLAVFLALCMLLSFLPFQTAEAAFPLTDETLYGYNKTHVFAPNGEPWGNADPYGGPIHKMYLNGKVAFCMEPSTVHGTYVNQDGGTAGYWEEADAYFRRITSVSGLKHKLDLIAYFGWEQTEKTDWHYAMTAMLLWETIVHEVPNFTTTHGGKMTDIYFSNGSRRNEFAAFKQSVLEKIAATDQRVTSWTGQTIQLRQGQSVTVTDTNGVLPKLKPERLENGGVSIAISGNDVTVTAEKTAQMAVSPKFWFNGMSESGADLHADTKFYILDSDGYSYQRIATFDGYDPLQSCLTVQVLPGYGYLRIQKKDAVTKQPLEGFGFRLDAQGNTTGIFTDGKYVGTKVYYTGADGSVLLDPLLPGDYRVTEISQGGSYLPGEENSKIVHIPTMENSEHPIEVEFENPQQFFDFSLQKYFKTSETGEASLAGAEFEVRVKSLVTRGVIGQRQEGDVVGTYVADENGRIQVKDLPLGEYEVRETKAPTGCVLNPQVLVVKSVLDKGDGTQVPEKSSKVTYEIAPVEQAANDGMARKEEALQAEGFARDSGLGVSITPMGENAFAELPIYGRIELYKHYEPDGDSVDEQRLAEGNLRFVVKRGEEVVDTITTGKDGRGRSCYLPYGMYTVSQLDVAKDQYGNELTSRIEDFTVSIDEDGKLYQYELTNPNPKMRLRLQKMDAVTGENILQTGIVFEIHRAADDSVVTFSDGRSALVLEKENGYALTLDRLPAGAYYLKEIAAPTGYYLPEDAQFPFEIPYEIGQDARIPVVTVEVGGKKEDAVPKEVENQPQEGSLVVKKTGAVLSGWVDDPVTVPVQEEGHTEERTIAKPQAGIALVLMRRYQEALEIPGIPQESGVSEQMPAQKLVEKESQETVLTDENGAFSREVGEGSYTLTNGAGEILAESTVAQGETGLLSVQLPPIESKETMRVPGEVVDKTFVTKKPVYQKQALPGAVFTLTAKEDVQSYDQVTKFFKKGEALPIAQQDIVVDGKTLYEKGAVITRPALSEAMMQDETLVKRSFVTGKEETKLSRIPLGAYELEEIQAPVGYKRDSEKRVYTFTPQIATVRVALKETDAIENARQILSARLSQKTLEETRYFGRGGLDFIHFGLFTQEAVEGLEKDCLIAVVSPDEKGVLTVSDIPQGAYYFKEISTKDGYVLHPEEIAFSVMHDGQEQDVVQEIDREIVNAPHPGKEMVLVKVDRDTKTPIQGATFRLFAVKDDGTRLPVCNGADDLWHTGTDGKIVTPKLPLGTYEWEEVTPAPGYVKGGTSFHIAVSEDANVEVEVPNDRTEIGIRKYDVYTGKPVVGARLRLVDEKGAVLLVKKDVQGIWTVSYDGSGEPCEWESGEEFQRIKGLLPGGQYRLEEIQAAGGYATSRPLNFTVENRVGLQLTGLSNQPTIVKIRKIDESSREAVYGATLELHEMKEDGSIREEVFVDPVTGRAARWTTTKENDAGYVVNGLVVGKTYVVKETGVPEGYLAPFAQTALLVVDTEDVQEVIFTNEPVPEIATKALFSTAVKEAVPTGNLQVRDEVTMQRLVPGASYTLSTSLRNRAHPEEVLASATTPFIAEKTEQVVMTPLSFDGTPFVEGADLVVTQVLSRDGRQVALHEDVNDPAQQLTLPKIGTQASDPTDGRNDAQAKKAMRLQDVVRYSHLIPGTTYEVIGKAVDKETGKVLFDDAGHEITAKTTFIPQASDGEVTLQFSFDGLHLAGKTLVFFESVRQQGAEIAVHADIDDEAQTIYVPGVRTKATTSSGGKEAPAGRMQKVTDLVQLSNLRPGTRYHLISSLMDSEGRTIREKDVFFNAKEANETKKIAVTFDAIKQAGKKVVFFEELYVVTEEGEKLVAEHRDLTDAQQTLFVKTGSPKTGDPGAWMPLLTLILCMAVIAFLQKKELTGK